MILDRDCVRLRVIRSRRLQQNHDRLAQKAGFPQTALNEIHGAWGDHKNRVLQMDECLRSDLSAWLDDECRQADCVLALGSSLCGMTADGMCLAAARHNGLVICSLQRTPFDDVAAVRVWALLDDFLAALCRALSVPAVSPPCRQRGAQWVRDHPACAYHTPVRVRPVIASASVRVSTSLAAPALACASGSASAAPAATSSSAV